MQGRTWSEPLRATPDDRDLDDPHPRPPAREGTARGRPPAVGILALLATIVIVAILTASL